MDENSKEHTGESELNEEKGNTEQSGRAETEHKTDEQKVDIDAEAIEIAKKILASKRDRQPGTQTAQEAYNSEIHNTILRVQQLVKYAAEAGKEIDGETQQFIANFSRKVLTNGTWSTEEEAKFWDSICSLSSELAPVNYDTLESSGNKAKTYVWVFGGLTLFLLAFLVYSQFVWVVLSNVSATIDARIQDINETEIKLEDLSLRKNALSSELKEFEKIGGGTDVDFARRSDRIRELKTDIQANERAYRETKIKDLEIRDQLTASTRILVGWLPFQGWLRTTRPPDPSFWNSEDKQLEKLQNIKDWEVQQKEESSFRNKALHTWAIQILHGMSAYLLPMIYGLVGACAFVLRSMSRQIRELTFSAADSTVQYMLRLVLGALAGISIGWFLKPDPSATNIVSTISPLGIAFVAGYSVELLFTAMDKVIKAFTGSDPGQPKTGEKAIR